MRIGSGYDTANRSLSFTIREIGFSDRMSPHVAIGFERTADRSGTSVAVTSNANGSDATALGSVMITSTDTQ